MRKAVALLLLTGSVTVSAADGMYGNLNPAGNELRPPTPLVVVEEGGGALLVGAVGAFAFALFGGYVGSRLDNVSADGINWMPLPCAGYSGALVGLPLGAATGCYLAGSLEKQGGAWWAATLGAYAGTAVGLGLAFLGYQSEEAGRGAVAAPLYVLAGAAPVAGAVTGYNISTPCLSARCYEERFAVVGSGIDFASRQRAGDGTVLRVQLLSLRI